MIQVQVFNFVSLSDAGCVPRIEFGCSRYKFQSISYSNSHFCWCETKLFVIHHYSILSFY